MQEFTLYHLLATVACIALFVWLRIRLFGKLNNPAADAGVGFQNAAPVATAASSDAGESHPAIAESASQHK